MKSELEHLLDDFCKKINESKWKGSFVECGAGAPLYSEMMNRDGASNTVLYAESPYNSKFQAYDGRSVSLNMALATSKEAFAIAEDAMFGVEDAQNLFSVAITAAHYKSSNSHAWIVVRTKDDVHHMHFYIDCRDYICPTNRSEFSKATQKIAMHFIEATLFPTKSWSSYLHDMTDRPGTNIHVDVIKSKNLSLIETLALCKKQKPLLYHQGEFKRVVDYLREDYPIYRGSFNPPTMVHQHIGSGCIFEVTITNARKGNISMEDLSHRVNMLDDCGYPILITSNCPTFCELHESLLGLANKPHVYHVGVDTYNAIVSDEFNPYEHYLHTLLDAKFIAFSGDGMKVEKTKYSRYIDATFVDVNKDVPTYHSTDARSGDVSGLGENIINYIEKHDLYK